MIIALDSFYKDDVCNTSLVVFDDLQSDVCVYADTIYTQVCSGYIPGEFYKRELPGIEKILDKLKAERQDLWKQINLIIVDSFVYLATAEKAWDGLGARLYHSLEASGDAIPVIGVAKTNFGICDVLPQTKSVRRGSSNKPLYVQGIGLDEDFDEEGFIKKLAGNYRIPTMLKEVDRLSRLFA